MIDDDLVTQMGGLSIDRSRSISVLGFAIATEVREMDDTMADGAMAKSVKITDMLGKLTPANRLLFIDNQTRLLTSLIRVFEPSSKGSF